MFHFKYWFLLIVVQSNQYKCDYFTSISGLEKLLAAEAHIVENLEKYVRVAELRLAEAQKFLENTRKELPTSVDEARQHYQHPLRAFKAIRRLTRVWPYLQDFKLNLNTGSDVGELLILPEGMEVEKPSYDDVVGAALGIRRLQSMYKLQTEDIGNGVLLGHNTTSEMRVTDMYGLGTSLMSGEEYKYAIEWLSFARRKLAQLPSSKTTQRMDGQILTDLARAFFYNGNTKLAMLLTTEQLETNPGDEAALGNLHNFTQSLTDEKLKSVWKPAKPIDETPSKVIELYEKTCRGEVRQTARELRDLHCRYLTGTTPFGLIAPFKVEELSLDPYVAYYHEVIYESEIAKIFEAAAPKISRSLVGTVESIFSNVRTSKNSWLWYSEHDFLNTIATRLTDITGLSLETAEALQVANYGIGGHYGPHYDFLQGGVRPEVGNRILTALFYINKEPLGGATAFPFLRLAVPPVRRSLVLWYNLHESLELDYRTRHAGCPVIKGSKWICNEWYHEIGQEFKRPCGLQPDGHKSIQFKGNF